MPDPEETEREALADLIEATSTEWEADFKAEGIRIGNHADFVANRLIASGFRRLSESTPVTFEQVEAVASTIDAVLGPVRITNVETVRVARAVIERLRLSESEIRRETVEQVATWLEGFDWGGSWDWADATASEVPAFIRTYWPKEKN